MKKGNKKGQFYLVAAIVIISIIVGFAVVQNYARSKPRITVYDLAKELNIEGWKVTEYGIVQMEDKRQNFSGKYEQYAGEGLKMFFIYGDAGEIRVFESNRSDEGKIYLGSVGTAITGTRLVNRSAEFTDIDTNNQKITVKNVEGKDYDFELKEGENFYFIIIEKIGDEVYVAAE